MLDAKSARITTDELRTKRYDDVMIKIYDWISQYSQKGNVSVVLSMGSICQYTDFFAVGMELTGNGYTIQFVADKMTISW